MNIFKNKVLVLALIVLTLLISGCSSKNDDTVATDNTPAATEEVSAPTSTDEAATEEESDVAKMTEEEKMAEYGDKMKELDSGENMDEPVFRVNGVEITRKEYETVKLTNEYNGASLTTKDAVDALVLKTAIEAEVKKLGITPEQAEIDNVVNQTKTAVETDEKAREATYTYIEALGMTEDEYWIYLEETVKEMFLRKSLEEYVKANKGVTDFNAYCYELVQNSTVKFLDTDIKNEYFK